MKSNDIKQALPTVLVVDDDEKNLLAMRTVIEELPVTIIEAASGDDALRMALENDLALILLDVQMPGMDGFEVAGFLRKKRETAQIPIIFVTAINKEIQYIQKGHDLGAVDYLFKPVDASILKSKIMVFVNYYLQNNKMQRLLSQLNTTKEDLEVSNKKLDHLAHFDVVTGLPNRLNFNEFLATALQEATLNHSMMAVLYLDLDDFKQVNDTLGHAAGDMLLKEVSLRIKSCIRSSDVFYNQPVDVIVSRLGGDEFALVLTDIGAPINAGLVAERIVQVIHKPFHITEKKVNIGISIGVACFPDAGKTANQLKKSADTAMYNAKRKGKSNFQYSSSQLNKQHERNLSIESHLKSALLNQELSLVYQPIVSLVSHQVVACEALCRLHHPELGDIDADELTVIAEKMNLIQDIGQWACEQALKEFHENILKKIPDMIIHINLSSKKLQADKFVKFSDALLNRYQPDHQQVVFELAETVLMHDILDLKNKADSLSIFGFQMSVDDFGTGYSSLGRLTSLPITSVKLDKRFIKGVESDGNIKIIVKSMIDLIKNLHAKSIAEGIETKEQLTFLTESGCDFAQGSLLAKPMLIDELSEFLQNRDCCSGS